MDIEKLLLNAYWKCALEKSLDSNDRLNELKKNVMLLNIEGDLLSKIHSHDMERKNISVCEANYVNQGLNEALEIVRNYITI